jgi:uncharacterized protein
MSTSLAVTALLMGLVGGPHCVAMCGAACAGIGRAAGDRSTRALLGFQASRIAGYAVMGAVAGGSVQGLAWLGTNTAALRPVWTMFHVAALLLGAVLVWQARQPAWIDQLGQTVWRKARPAMAALGPRAPYVLGLGWALMPCGLLYSALLVAALSAGAAEGAGVMALFAAGTSVSLLAGPWLLLRMAEWRSGGWGIRLVSPSCWLRVGRSGWV